MRIIELSPEDVEKRLAEKTILLVDVREVNEFQSEKIEGARNFPLSSFDPKSLPSPAEADVVFHCGVGKRSAMAVEKCRASGIDHVTHMQGGLQAWKSGGHPTTKA
jgi:rhodanese-related sulfurtransferase